MGSWNTRSTRPVHRSARKNCSDFTVSDSLRWPFRLSRSPVMDTCTSFSLMPGRSTLITSSSFVSYMSADGVHVRSRDGPWTERPKNVSKRRSTSDWISPRSLAPTHGSSPCPTGRQRTTVMTKPSLNLAGPHHGAPKSKSEELIYADISRVKIGSKDFYKALKYLAG